MKLPVLKTVLNNKNLSINENSQCIFRTNTFYKPCISIFIKVFKQMPFTFPFSAKSFFMCGDPKKIYHNNIKKHISCTFHSLIFSTVSKLVWIVQRTLIESFLLNVYSYKRNLALKNISIRFRIKTKKIFFDMSLFWQKSS